MSNPCVFSNILASVSDMKMRLLLPIVLKFPNCVSVKFPTVLTPAFSTPPTSFELIMFLHAFAAVYIHIIYNIVFDLLHKVSRNIHVYAVNLV